MKKVFSRGLSLFVILTLALIMCVSTAAAAPTPYASDFLNQYDGVVSSEGDGTIKISFSVVGTGKYGKMQKEFCKVEILLAPAQKMLYYSQRLCYTLQ